jgi:energy-coupling factor transport system substrate-specific component
MGGLKTAIAWWIAGIPWDIVHGVANFVIMIVLYKPMVNVMKKIRGNDL